jgi:penicillin-binding protein 1A
MLFDAPPAPLPPGVAAANYPNAPPDPVAPPPPRRSRGWNIAAVALALFLLLVAYLAVTAPLSKSLQPIAAPGLTLLSSAERPIARRGAVTDEPVDVTKLPDHVGGAFLAIEDRRFRNHMGVDPWGIGRAAVRNALAGEVREGGSTITQQLAKLAFLNSDRTAARKFRELILAFWLEAWLSKDQILSRYLSSAYFGDNVYGLRAASQHYFNRAPEKLTLAQSAMLAGLVKAPSRLAPTGNLEGARARAKVVLGAMVEAGVIDASEAKGLAPARLRLGPAKDLPTGTYFADWAFPEARAATEIGYGEQTVTTTLDDRLQRLAVRAVGRAGLGSAQVALVAMRPDGKVVAMIGGKSYKASPFNRATQARRQPGSTFKLFVYLAALRAGMTPDSRVEDAPITIGDWSPKNNDGRYRGSITLREAFAASSNVAAVRLSERVGRDEVIKAARDLGITTPLSKEPSMALGTSTVPLIQMVSAYAAVAGGNFPVKPHALPDREEGWFATLRSRMRSFNERSTWPMLLDLLRASVRTGTSRAAALPVQSFGKTGTSQDNRDAIFIGFAGDLVVGVWIGNDDNRPLKGVQGGGLPARIWRDFMSSALPGQPVRASRPVERPEPARPQIDADGASITVPLEGTGYKVGVEFKDDELSVSAEPMRDGEEIPEPNLPDFVPLPPRDDATGPEDEGELVDEPQGS